MKSEEARGRAAYSATKSHSLTPAAARVLETASDLFYTHGIRAVGVDTIAERAGVTKKTLYDRFGSKEELVAEYLRTRDQRWRRFLTSYVEESEDDPKARVLAVFEALGQWMEKENPRGCGFVNAFVELTDHRHPGREVARAQKKWLLEYFRELLEACDTPNPDDVAEKLLIIHEGATITNSMGSAQESARKSRDIAEVLITG
ncbi:TetR/AcrR family transcriptional regulator [Nocardiopsis rhodophaea]|uniref:TetR/AcrR family transcriptional regulator n=1 Tax=Nocardiopsis rhodophaea TaxID=280238 RepID=A0ABN2S232_9ACTN